ncbi:MAG: hypothetical protein HDT21_01525 [Ruminococcus sp.]|nr:hypothetical protein [Ruminococcus sp.]
MTVVIPHPFHRFERYAPAGAGKEISPPAGGDQGLCPVDLATFEKVDETFPWRLRRLKNCYIVRNALNQNLSFLSTHENVPTVKGRDIFV